MRAWHEANVYARTNGYVKSWMVDIGGRVKTNDLLALIESPEVDAQLRQAYADVRNAKANYLLAAVTAKRWVKLLKTDSVSKQETDEKVSAEKATYAILASARANLQRLSDLVGFERVNAPFDGIITSRTTDIGALINSGSTPNVPLFHIVQADPLRIYVRVPQNYASRITRDMIVTLHFSQNPDKVYSAKLVETAKAINLNTRTLLTQFETDNKDYKILPGGYTEVRFAMPVPDQIVQLPVNTLLFRAQGMQVATIDGDNKVKLIKINISRDFGTYVEVNSGVTAGESIILNPSDSIFDGQQVRIATDQQNQDGQTPHEKNRPDCPDVYSDCLISLLACTKYQRPQMDIPGNYKESGLWKHARPHVAEVNRGAWWLIFADPELNTLEEKVTCDNQNVKAAFARYQEARAQVEIARSYYFPTIKGIFSSSREQASGSVANKEKVSIFSDQLIGANLAYELDVFGRLRNMVVASEYRAVASADDLAALRLSMQAELASDYFSLRATDASQRTLDTMVRAYQRSFGIVSRRHKEGTAAEADVDQAKEQLDNAKTQAADIRLVRAQYEHAIATLIAEVPANFSLKAVRYKPTFMAIAPYYPSTLLERRPDIAAAERRVQAANADIGVARAAFFPDFNIYAQAGFESATFKNLFKMPSLFWSLGPAALAISSPTASVTLFDGGRLRGLLDEAKATYHETVANYRQTVLSAFQDVEDNLAAQRQLQEEYHTQTAAAHAAKRAYTQAEYRYQAGIDSYLYVVVAENIALQSELSLIDIEARRQLATVRLIKALGGGWNT